LLFFAFLFFSFLFFAFLCFSLLFFSFLFFLSAQINIIKCRPIAHGLLTLSLAPFLVEKVMPKIEGVKYGVNYGFNKVKNSVNFLFNLNNF
jgi:hypothetical protein